MFLKKHWAPSVALVTLHALSNLSHANDEAYSFGTTLTLETVTNLQGGVEEGTHNLGNLDVTLAVDTQAAGWWNNGSFYFYVLGDDGKNPSELTGDLQGISNIAAPKSLKLFECWYKHHFANDAVQVLVGLHNYNASFYAIDSAGLFSSSSFGIGIDTAQVGPSIFPTSALATLVKFQNEQFYAQAAVYDGIAGDPNNQYGTHIQFNDGDGLFEAVEAGVVEEKKYKLALGGWQHTAQLENPVTGEVMDKNHGLYLIGEKYFAEQLVAFFQYGHAASETNQVDQYLGAGIRYNNAWKENDSIGLAVAHAENGEPFLAQNPDLLSAETAFEGAYLVPLNSHFTVKTSLYYVEHPSMDPVLENALAVGLRLYISL